MGPLARIHIFYLQNMMDKRMGEISWLTGHRIKGVSFSRISADFCPQQSDLPTTPPPVSDNVSFLFLLHPRCLPLPRVLHHLHLGRSREGPLW